MHKDHILQDCSWHICGWGLLDGYMDDYSKMHWWWVLTYMMIGCFVHILIDADLPYWWYLVHAWLWHFSHMIEWFYILYKRMSWWGHTLMIHASCWSSCYWQILWSRSYSVVADIYIMWLVFSHDVMVCLYCSHLFRSCNDLCWFPHYAWDE